MLSRKQTYRAIGPQVVVVFVVGVARTGGGRWLRFVRVADAVVAEERLRKQDILMVMCGG